MIIRTNLKFRSCCCFRIVQRKENSPFEGIVGKHCEYSLASSRPRPASGIREECSGSSRCFPASCTVFEHSIQKDQASFRRQAHPIHVSFAGERLCKKEGPPERAHRIRQGSERSLVSTHCPVLPLQSRRFRSSHLEVNGFPSIRKEQAGPHDYFLQLSVSTHSPIETQHRQRKKTHGSLQLLQSIRYRRWLGDPGRLCKTTGDIDETCSRVLRLVGSQSRIAFRVV